MLKKYKILVLLISISVLIAIVAAIAAFRNAQLVIEETAKDVAASSSIPFDITSVVPASVPTGFALLVSNGDFESFTIFEGQIFICNRSSLVRYDTGGKLLQTWRVGLDLPANPLVSLAVRQGIPQPELWIATDGGGALIWDSHTFRQFTPRDPQLRKLTSLLALPNGNMLLATLNAGLYSTDARQLTLFHSELKGVPVTALARGSSPEDIWIGTRDQGAWLWRAGTLTRFVGELPDQQVLSLFGSNDRVWVGTPNGVAEFADGHFVRRLAEGVFSRSLTEKSGQLWISTIDEGTLSVPLKAHTSRSSVRMRGGERNNLSSVMLLPYGDGVLALENANIRRLPENKEILEPALTALSNDHITALNVYRGLLWVGYFNRGLDLLSTDSNARSQHFEDDVLFCVNRIKRKPDSDQTFIATANGMVLFDNTSQPRQVITSKDGLISSHVTDVLFGDSQLSTNSTVVATSSGLTFMNGPAISSVYAFQGLVNNHVYTLTQAGENIVAGTLGGVSVFKTGLIQASFTTANSDLRQNWITASATVGDKVYLGTYGSGIQAMDAHFNVESFREFSGKRTEVNQNAMLATHLALYAGTAGQGLAFLPMGEQRWHFWKTGLPSVNVTALAAEGDILYIGTDNGLVRIPERSLNL